MNFDPQKHHRRSIRLNNFDYAQPGGYFITIVTHQRDMLFGEIVNGKMGAYVVMPNHIHGVIVINDGPATKPSPDVGTRHASSLPPHGVKPKSIGAIVGSFKSAVTRRIGREHNVTGIWQRNYYEHVIRNHDEWDRIHRYIEANSSGWVEDKENPLKT